MDELVWMQITEENAEFLAIQTIYSKNELMRLVDQGKTNGFRPSIQVSKSVEDEWFNLKTTRNSH